MSLPKAQWGFRAGVFLLLTFPWRLLQQPSWMPNALVKSKIQRWKVKEKEQDESLMLSPGPGQWGPRMSMDIHSGSFMPDPQASLLSWRLQADVCAHLPRWMGFWVTHDPQSTLLDAPCWLPPRALNLMHSFDTIPGSSICLETRAGLRGQLQCPKPGVSEPSSSFHQSGRLSGRGVWGSQSLASAAEFLLSWNQSLESQKL